MAWTFYTLAAPFSTSDNTTPQVVGLGFTPAAGKRYWFRAALAVQSTLTSVAPWIGAAWATGYDRAMGRAQMARTRNLQDPGSRNYGDLTPVAVTNQIDIDVANESYWGRVEGTFDAGATPAGTVEIVAQVEGSSVGTITIAAGSALMVWEY